jgi:hypothetical protein
MRMNNIRMTTKVDRLKLLETLRANRAKHAKIVAEAREGYIAKAQQSLTKRLAMLKEGQLVALTFTLKPPVDYTETYDNSIAMLEWNVESEVELEADEFRQLVRDEWDWTTDFLNSNSRYSGTAMSWLNDLTGGALVSPPD